MSSFDAALAGCAKPPRTETARRQRGPPRGLSLPIRSTSQPSGYIWLKLPSRPGFARLVSEVGLDHVGIVLGIEMSRLAPRYRPPPNRGPTQVSGAVVVTARVFPDAGSGPGGADCW